MPCAKLCKLKEPSNYPAGPLSIALFFILLVSTADIEFDLNWALFTHYITQTSLLFDSFYFDHGFTMCLQLRNSTSVAERP